VFSLPEADVYTAVVMLTDVKPHKYKYSKQVKWNQTNDICLKNYILRSSTCGIMSYMAAVYSTLYTLSVSVNDDKNKIRIKIKNRPVEG
jgi:hypothetical protein